MLLCLFTITTDKPFQVDLGKILITKLIKSHYYSGNEIVEYVQGFLSQTMEGNQELIIWKGIFFLPLQ